MLRYFALDLNDNFEFIAKFGFVAQTRAEKNRYSKAFFYHAVIASVSIENGYSHTPNLRKKHYSGKHYGKKITDFDVKS
jgi:hypothetical protein